MTLIEDAYEEMLADFGETFLHYPHNGYRDEDDDFWLEDQEHEQEGIEFTGQLVVTEHEGPMDEGGFGSGSDIVVRTQYMEVEEGDKVEVYDKKWIASTIGRRRIQGREFANELELTSANR